jgi:hypothetical protein
MNWLDFICLWVGYAVCVLALVRSVIDGVFATIRTYRRAARWVGKILWSRIPPMDLDGGP